MFIMHMHSTSVTFHTLSTSPDISAALLSYVSINVREKQTYIQGVLYQSVDLTALPLNSRPSLRDGARLCSVAMPHRGAQLWVALRKFHVQEENEI